MNQSTTKIKVSRDILKGIEALVVMLKDKFKEEPVLDKAFDDLMERERGQKK